MAKQRGNKEGGVVHEAEYLIAHEDRQQDKQFVDLMNNARKETPEPKPDQTLTQILLAISAIEEAVHFLEETAKRNPKYRGKLVTIVNRMRPIVSAGRMTDALKKALQRG